MRRLRRAVGLGLAVGARVLVVSGSVLALAGAPLAGAPLGGAPSAGAGEGGDGDVIVVDAAPELLDEVSGRLMGQGWYVEEASGATEAEVAEVSARIAAAGEAWGLVTLSTPPPRGTRNFAANLLAEVRSSGSSIDTVVVLTLEDVAAAKMRVDEDVIDSALGLAIPTLEQDVGEGLVAVHAQLSEAALPPAPEDGGGLPGGAVAVVGLAAAVVAAGAVVAAVARRRRQPVHV